MGADHLSARAVFCTQPTLPSQASLAVLKLLDTALQYFDLQPPTKKAKADGHWPGPCQTRSVLAIIGGQASPGVGPDVPRDEIVLTGGKNT